MALPNTPQLRSWFFRAIAPVNVRGAQINLADKGEPDQDLFEKLVSSCAFLTEASDRAKINTGGALADEVGLVAATTGAKAKAGTSGLEADRTLVPLAENLPNTIAGPSQTITGTFNNYSGPMFTIADDLSSADRNVYAVTFHPDFIAFMNSVTAEIDSINVVDGDQTTDISEIRTTTGTSDGDTDMGVFVLPGSGVVTDSTTAKALFQELANYLADVGATGPGGAWVNITPNASVIEALEDLDASVSAAGGEVNTISLLGGTNLFSAKVGADYPFRGAANGSYINANVGATTFTFDLDLVGLYTPLDARYLELTDTSNTTFTTIATSVGGGTDIVKARTGNNYDIKSLSVGSGITINDTGTLITLEVDDSYINSLISASMTSGQGNAKSYLFSARSVAEPTILAGATGHRAIFEDDFSDGLYDYNNTWTTSQWTASADAVTDVDVQFAINVSITTLATESVGVKTLTFTLYHQVDVAAPTALGTCVVSIPSSGAAGDYSGNAIINVSTLGPAISLGDKIYLEITANTLSVDFDIKTGSSIYNLEV